MLARATLGFFPRVPTFLTLTASDSGSEGMLSAWK